MVLLFQRIFFSVNHAFHGIFMKNHPTFLAAFYERAVAQMHPNKDNNKK